MAFAPATVVSVDVSPTRERLAPEAALELQARVLGRLLERGFSVVGIDGDTRVEIGLEGDDVILEAEHRDTAVHSKVPGAGPWSIVMLEVVHRAVELTVEVDAVDASDSVPAIAEAPRIAIELADDGAVDAPDILPAMLSHGVVIVPWGGSADTRLCLTRQGDTVLARPAIEDDCDAADPDAASSIPVDTLLHALTQPRPPPPSAPVIAAGATRQATPFPSSPRWHWDLALCGGAMFRWAESRAAGFDGLIGASAAAVHRSRFGVAGSVDFVPTTARDLEVFELLVSAGPAWRFAWPRRVALRLSGEVGTLVHLASFGGGRFESNVDFDVRVPVQISIRAGRRFQFVVKAFGGYAHRGRRHWIASMEDPFWSRGRWRVGVSLGVGLGGPPR